VAVFDLRERKVTQELRGEELALLVGGRSPAATRGAGLLEVAGRIWLATADASARGRTGARLDAESGTFVPATVPAGAATPLALKGTERWRDCACAPAPAAAR
jgi:hypothetical protein